MADDAISLGKLSLDAEIDLTKFSRNVQEGRRETASFEEALDALASIADVASHAVGNVRMTTGQAGESRVTAEAIVSGVRGIKDESIAAARELDRVRLTDRQAAESDAAGELIKHNVKDIGDEADRTKRKLAEVKLAGGRNGVGVGPFGSGFGRIGVLGAGISLGALTAPAAGPAALGVLAMLPGLLAGAAGAAGTLFLALGGVGKAIGGDKKAFDQLEPSAQQFVLTIRSLEGWVDKLKQTAGENLFPGLTQGLHSALSPGMVNAITTAVAELAHALGLAGEAWGRYFGSAEFQSIFGPLMQEGAKNIGTLSDTLLHLFDALGVVARAAIPFTEWLAKAIDEGAKLADQWIHAKDASGQLSGAMGEAETSLRLVGGLLEALLKVLGALGVALYPIAKVAVKDLTDGLDALAGIIQRNQGTIRDIVSGALAALILAVKVLSPLIGGLAKAIEFLVGQIGGWKVAFAALLAIGLAKVISGWISNIGSFATSVTGAQTKLDALRGSLKLLAAVGIITVEVDIIQRALKSGAMTGLNKAGDLLPIWNGHQWVDPNNNHPLPPAGQRYWNSQYPNKKDRPRSNGQQGGGRGTPGAPTPGKTHYTQSDVYKLLLANGVPSDVAANLALISAKGEDPSGNISALNNNPRTGDYSIGLFQENFLGQMGVDRVRKYAPMFGLNPNMSVAAFVKWLGQHPSAQAKIAYDIYSGSGYGAWTTAAGLGISDQGSPYGTPPPFTTNTGGTPKPPKPPVIPPAATAARQLAGINAAQAQALGNTGRTAKRYLENELADLKVAQRLIDEKLKHAKGADARQLSAASNNIEKQIIAVQAKIAKAVFPTGDALLPAKLRDRLSMLQSKYAADAAYASVLTGDAAEKYQATLTNNMREQARTLMAEKASLERKLKTSTGAAKKAVQQELDKVNQQLSSVDGSILQALEGVVQSMQSKESSVFSSVQSEFQQQFEAQTQSMLDQLAVQFFQNGAQTPLEAQVASMQYQDQFTQLQQNLAQAKTSAEKAAAQRALDEFDLEHRAAQERAKADSDYAAAVKRIQEQRSQLEGQMNADLSKLSDGFLNGTATMADLQAIAEKYGITINQDTIPDFNNLSTATNNLVMAMQQLIDYIAQLTGQKPAGAPSIHAANATSEVQVGGGGYPNHQPPPIDISDTAMRGVAGGYTTIAAAGRMGDIVLQVDSEVFGRVAAQAIASSPSNVRTIAAPMKPALDRVTSI